MAKQPTANEVIRGIVKGYVLDNVEEFVGKSYEDICWDVSVWLDGVCEDAVNEGVDLAMNEFPPDHDPYDEAKERMILAKHGIEI